MFLLTEDLLQDRLRVPVLQLVAVSGSVLLFPSAPAAFVRHAAGAPSVESSPLSQIISISTSPNHDVVLEGWH
jgi:hypothetical protein